MVELQEQIEAVGRESQRQIELADKRKMLKSELRRLEDENSMQRDRITQMEHDLKVWQHASQTSSCECMHSCCNMLW